MTQSPLETRFWNKVNKDGPIPLNRPELGKCWVWTAAKNGAGYGKLGRGGRKEKNDYAHRISYELFVAPIPHGLEIDHLCRNKSCVNPNHLEPVSTRTNIIRGTSKNVQARLNGTCTHGHPLTLENSLFIRETRKGGRLVRRCKICRYQACARSRLNNPRPKVLNPKGRGATHHSAKLTESDVLEIRMIHASHGATLVDLAKRFNIAPSGVSGIVRRKTWKHLKDETVPPATGSTAPSQTPY